MTPTRREFIKTAGLGAAAMSLPGWLSNCGMGSKPPNILFIMSDDHAEQAISSYGSQFIQTPNIDRIANEGVRFTNSFVTSRATMLTGKYSNLNGLRDNRDEFDGSQMTFPKLLQKAGYHTSILGKWHLKTEPTGFNDWRILKGQGRYYNPLFTENGEKREYVGYTTDIITDMALETLQNRDSSRPFCMLVHHKAPHRNWMPNIKHLRAFDDVEIPLPETFYDDYQTRETTAGAADMRIDDMYLSFDLKLHPESFDIETGSGGNVNYAERDAENWSNTYERFTPEQKASWDAYYDPLNAEFKEAGLEDRELLEWKFQRYMKEYLACILSIDENIGRLLDYLDEEQLIRDTIVIYTSDQGFYLGEHGWYDKRFMYEESMGMPLVVRYPQEIPAGQVSDDMVLNLDFAPTFLDYAGITAPGEIQGESFRPLLNGSAVGEWRNSVYYHYYEYPHGWHDVKRHYGVRTLRYKLIHFYHDVDVWELYDLEQDPHELNNLYNDQSHAAIVAELKEELTRLQRKYGDTTITI